MKLKGLIKKFNKLIIRHHPKKSKEMKQLILKKIIKHYLKNQ